LFLQFHLFIVTGTPTKHQLFFKQSQRLWDHASQSLPFPDKTDFCLHIRIKFLQDEKEKDRNFSFSVLYHTPISGY